MKTEITSNLRLPAWSATSAIAPLLILLSGAPLLCAHANAADAPSPLTIAPPVPVSAGFPPAEAAPLPAPTAPLTNVADNSLATNAVPEDSRGAIAKNITAMEDKISENAKNVVKRLDASSDATTLADLNSARQTMTRIEAMIDLEKRLAELEKVRNDRNGIRSIPVSTSLANAIPASALVPPPRRAASQSGAASDGMPEVAPAAPTSFSHMEISRISGTDGKYNALLKSPNGDTKSVRVGDSVEGLGTVRSINASSVVIEGKGEPYTLHIKNVDNIYSAMR